MKPYYDHAGITLYHGDALETLAVLPEIPIDALVTDPPYCSGAIGEAQRTRAAGQGLRSENIRKFGWFSGDNMGTAGLCWLLRAVAAKSRRLVKPTGSALVFCDWRMLSAIQPAIESAGLRYQDLVVWDKGSMGLGNGFRKQHELVLHFTYGSPECHHRGTGNVIRSVRVDGDERLHQAQKPVQLMARLINVVCPPGGRILDPFCGSGSTLRAAKDEGRLAVGIEEDEAMCETAAKRMEQGVLFTEDPHA